MMRLAASWSRTPSEIRRLPPRKGQDGVAILREAGFSEREIEDLAARRALLAPERTPDMAES